MTAGQAAAEWTDPDEEQPIGVVPSPIPLLRKDLREAAKTMGVKEVRFLVDTYYQWQHERIASANQMRALGESGEPHDAVRWTEQRMLSLEDDVRVMLDVWTRTEPTGMAAWSRGICGIGPVIAAGLAAHIDITQAPTAGHIWRFAGLDPTTEWLGKEKAKAVVHTLAPAGGRMNDGQIAELAVILGRNAENLARQVRYAGKNKAPLAQPTATSTANAIARRPWNAGLKVVCWKLGESFVKVSGNPRDVYGKLYLQRKAQEQAKNERGEFAEQAQAKLAKYNIGKDTDAYAAYSAGKLPPAHIHARAKRYAVKIMLSHYQQEAYRRHYGTEPPKPFAVAILGHAHEIPGPPAR